MKITFPTCETVTQLVGAFADAFEIAFVAVDVGGRESNEYPSEVMSLKRLFAMTFPLVDFLLN